MNANKSLAMPIGRLGIALPIERKLQDAGIRTVGELAAHSPSGLSAIAPLSQKALGSIVEALGYLDLSLASEQPGEALNGTPSSKAKPASPKAATKKHPTESERAQAFANKHLSRRKGPRLDDPADRARLIELYNSITMEVEDAAWLYGIGRGVAYTSSKNGAIPTKKFADRNRVLSQPVFDELFGGAIPEWLRSAVTDEDVTGTNG